MVTEAERKKVLITRSHEGNAELAAKLRAIGWEPLVLDVLGLSPPEDWSRVDQALGSPGGYDWFVLTSATGARFFSERMRTLGIRPERVGTRIAAVGAKTAAALSERGWKVDFVPSRFLTRILAEELPAGRRALLLRSDISTPSLSETLRKRGFVVDEVAIYRTRHLDVNDMEAVEAAEMVIFGSPSAVDGLCSQLPKIVLSALLEKEAACIGPVTAKAARARGFTRILQCRNKHTFDSLLEEIGRKHRIDRGED